MTRLKLGFGQRLVIVLGVGAALVAIGNYIVSLGGPGFPVGWTGYSPLRIAAASGMPAGARLAVWLVITALWVAVSLFLLREQAAGPGDPPAAGS